MQIPFTHLREDAAATQQFAFRDGKTVRVDGVTASEGLRARYTVVERQDGGPTAVETQKEATMIAQQLSVFLANKPGVLADVCKSLAERNISILGFSISDTVDYAVVRLVVDDSTAAMHVLGDGGALVVENEILSVRLPNRTGSLRDLAERLSRAGVNIEYAYGSADGQEAQVFVRVSDTEKGEAALRG